MTQAIVALDLGTTSCRALVFDLDGRVLAQVSRTYPLHTPHPGYAEQDPAELLAAADAVVPGALARSGVDPSQVLGISLCTYLHAVVAVGPDGEYLTPAITWADGRSAPQVDAVRLRPDWHDLYARTGCPPHPMYPLYKLMWLQANRPDVTARAGRYVSVKELLVHHWTGQWLVDYGIASGTALFNLERLDWDDEALALAGIHKGQLPQPVPTTHTVPLSAGVAGRLGLRAGTPVVIGAGDGVLSSLGSGAIEPGVLAAMVGTSGALRACVERPQADPQARVWCYYLDKNRWILGGSLNNGGMVLRWVRDQLYPGLDNYDVLTAEAGKAPAGSGNLVFLPYLAGERSPGFNARARGVWFGLGLEHQRPHLVRSALEAVVYRLYSVLGPLEELAGPAREIRATGGFARSDLWLQIAADVFGRQVTVPAQTEGSALGAFILGAVALGVAPDLSWVHRFIQVDRRLEPDAATHSHYQKLFALYQRLNALLQDEFRTLAKIREGGAPPT
mgnify:CR=1 FL=1